MVDVWKELGKAIGAIFKPWFDLPGDIWRLMGLSAPELAEDIIKGAKDVADTVEPIIAPHLITIMDEATEALLPGSPKKEVKEASKKLTKALMKALEDSVPKKGESPPSLEVLLAAVAGIIATNTGLYIATSGVTMGLDLVHPVKELGFREAGADLVASFQLPGMIGPTLQAPIWSGVIAPLRMRMNQRFPYLVPGTTVLPFLRAKEIITEEEYQTSMRYNAFDETWSSAMLEHMYRYPSFSDLRTMIHRTDMTWADAKDALEKSLIHVDYVDRYEELIPGVPGSGDLVDMAVREAYQARPGDDEMPERFVVEMAKWGFDRDACLWFWRKHWVLPAVGQVYEMNHRIIEMPQSVEEYLKWADYGPEWRGPLEELSWNLPGRIDARWLFRWGEIEVADLQDLLEKGGLSHEWSERVARAVAKNQFLSDINRQIANIKADFIQGASVEATLRAELTTLGQRSEIVDYHVLDALADRERSIRTEKLRTLRTQYARAAITYDDVVTMVTPIIIDPEARDAWLAALPTAKQVVIMEETFTTELNRLVANAKYDYVRGFSLKAEMIAELQKLGFTDEVVTLHVRDAEGDRVRKRNDERLIVIKDMWMKDVEPDFDVIVGWAAEIIRESEALDLWLNDAYFDKLKTVRIPEVPPRVPAVTISVLKTAFRSGIISSTELAAELTARGYTAPDVELIIAVEAWKIKPEKIPDIPMSTLKRAFRDQILTVTQFRAELADRGYTLEDVTTIVAVEQKVIDAEMAIMPEEVKRVSIGTLRTAFREGIIDVVDMATELADRGYDVQDIALIIAVEEARIKPEKMVRMPLSTLKRAFRDQIIGEAEFRAQLDARGYSSDDVAVMVSVEMKALDEELAVMPEEVKTVSLGTLRMAFRLGVITQEALRGELVDRGFGPGDVDVIVEVELARIAAAVKVPAPPTVPVITLSKLAEAFRRGLITEAEYRAELRARDYSDRDIDVMVALEKEKMAAEAG